MVGGDARVLAACGSVVDDVHETARSFFEAEATLALLRRRSRDLQLRFASLGVSGLLLSLPRARLREFVQEPLGALLRRVAPLAIHLGRERLFQSVQNPVVPR